MTSTSTATVSPTAMPPANVSFKLISPSNNAQVGYAESVAGTAAPKEGQTVWVIVFNYKVARFYPQNGPVSPTSDGNWTSVAYFGTPTEGKGEKFDVVAVLADQNANSTLANYQTQSQQTNSYPGLTQLPSGIITQQKVTVTRTS
ncbi:MAG: hypothetical protein ACXV3D_00445 [Halobacteriota archaeon]